MATAVLERVRTGWAFFTCPTCGAKWSWRPVRAIDIDAPDCCLE